MSDVHIEKLALRLSGLDEPQSRRLVEKLAAGLQQALPAGELPVRAELVRFEIQPTPGAGMDSLVKQITMELVRELRRS